MSARHGGWDTGDYFENGQPDTAENIRERMIRAEYMSIRVDILAGVVCMLIAFGSIYVEFKVFGTKWMAFPLLPPILFGILGRMSFLNAKRAKKKLDMLICEQVLDS